ncbi:zwei Ig domain protein zig-8-like isoform X1 [Portunus trituberculatus]|uniref:zwei Ig domain protein zig-8-like isoform X1 n=1 Tax=Portunus trituberculatus TaxID=210409 RepID=UPI001E1CF6B4|nr:zwei Ig domain protein zig-8-like isoform X1 [Portunus trituberculatus]
MWAVRATWAFTLVTAGAAMGVVTVPRLPPPRPPQGARAGDVEARLDGSSSRPVAPIEPLMDLGGGGLAPPGPLQPVFDEAAPRSVSSLTGGTAYLHCVVHHLGGGSVSWIRRRDLHILTVGTYTYTTDQRFEVVHAAASRDWILKLRYAQERDSGLYDCQVSRRPVLTYSVRLSVYAPRASIVGAPDMHVDRGSTINLTCTVSHTPEPPAYIFWYHNGQVVNYESPRGGVTVVTEKGNVTRGFLLIQDARPSDSGNYTCAPSNTAPSWLRVHVLKGETPAAMQTNGGGRMAETSLGFLRVSIPLLATVNLILTAALTGEGAGGLSRGIGT